MPLDETLARFSKALDDIKNHKTKWCAAGCALERAFIAVRMGSKEEALLMSNKIIDILKEMNVEIEKEEE